MKIGINSNLYRFISGTTLLLVAGCAHPPPEMSKPASVVEVNRNFARYEGRELTLEGVVGQQQEQLELWTSAVYAVHMFGPPRAENCIRLDSTGLADKAPLRGTKYRVTGTIVSVDHLPEVWGVACPSRTALRIKKAVQISEF